MAVDGIKKFGEEDFIVSPTNLQKTYPVKFEVTNECVVFGRPISDDPTITPSFTVPIGPEYWSPSGSNNENITFIQEYNLDQFDTIMVKKLWGSVNDFFHIESLDELSQNGSELNGLNDDTVLWLRRYLEALESRVAVFETGAESRGNVFPTVRPGEVLVATKTGWEGKFYPDVNSLQEIKTYTDAQLALIESTTTTSVQLINNTTQESIPNLTAIDSNIKFNGVTAYDSLWKLSDASKGDIVDGVAVQSIDQSTPGTFITKTSGAVEIPNEITDDEGNAFVEETYYYQSPMIAGKFTKHQPIGTIVRKVFKTFLWESKMWALIDLHSQSQGEAPTAAEYIKYFSSIEAMQQDVTLGVSQQVAVKTKTYIIYPVKEGDDVELVNGLFARYNMNDDYFSDTTPARISTSSSTTLTTGVKRLDTGKQLHMYASAYAVGLYEQLSKKNLLKVDNNNPDLLISDYGTLKVDRVQGEADDSKLLNGLESSVEPTQNTIAVRNNEGKIKGVYEGVSLYDGAPVKSGTLNLSDDWTKFNELEITGEEDSGNLFSTTISTTLISNKGVGVSSSASWVRGAFPPSTPSQIVNVTGSGMGIKSVIGKWKK